VARKVRIWTWDKGSRPVDMAGPPELLVPILETVLTGALWRELKKFPPDTLARLLPRLDVAPNLRRLVEIWVEEKGGKKAAPPARAASVARSRARRRSRQQPRARSRLPSCDRSRTGCAPRRAAWRSRSWAREPASYF